MAFDSATRNRLAHFVADARGLIAEEFTQQFQSLYGISPKGDCTPLEKLPHLDEMQLATAALLRERIQYLIKSHPDDKGGAQAAVERLAREQAFTVLNRFAAIRMAEKRGIIVESIGKSYQSKGFKVYETVAGSGLGEAYHRYQRYLFCLFDELAVDLGVLFDRRSPHALLFPREQALLAMLELINAPEIEPLWAEDETVGWIYQYYNDPLERKKMREQSAAPRNSRELAVRNQFFTPRYVVEFLTDNTLGRIWYEMTKGQTRLKDQCRYLVRRPTEIFLNPGETAPCTPENSESNTQNPKSQEELLRDPIHIPHRPLKDPREIRLLDPACGSMHFGLYAFDLFEVIYEEFWDLTTENTEHFSNSSPSSVSSVHSVVNTPLRTLYTTKEEFLRDVPRLIIENNLHGIDIDPRCAQIAGLSLWLRAQKAWQRLGLKPAERPAIKSSNIVCAEPMPGEKELLREFVEREFPAAERAVCLRLLEAIFDKMQLAGEAGSLLKIEEEIRSAIEDAKKQWKAGPKMEQSQLFDGEKLKQQAIPLDYSGLTESEFWDQLEEKIYIALRDYAEQAENGGGFQRRLFAEDAARGFAFIDVCRKRYDVALMNPPFGDAAEILASRLKEEFPTSSADLAATFIENGMRMLTVRGYIGAITARGIYFLSSFESFRREKILQDAALRAFVDLGGGVLDALIDTALLIAESCTHDEREALCIGLAKKNDKDSLLFETSTTFRDATFRATSFFAGLPSAVFSFWTSEEIAKLLRHENSLEALGVETCVGLQTDDDNRFLRLVWEVTPASLSKLDWSFVSKGGEFSRFWEDIHLLVRWATDGRELKSATKYVRNVSQYFRKGLTYPFRTAKGFNVRVLPQGCIFTLQGMAVFAPADDHETLYFLAGLLNTRPTLHFLRMLTSADAYQAGYVRQLPGRIADVVARKTIAESTQKVIATRMRLEQFDEVSKLFATPLLATSQVALLSQEAKSRAHHFSHLSAEYSEGLESINTQTVAAFALRPDDEARCHSEIAEPPLEQAEALSLLFFPDIVSYLCGIALGRWDVRYATGEQTAPELPDPFAPLPVCPPGQLQNAQGLPLGKEEVGRMKEEGIWNYPTEIPWDGILVDDPNHPLDIERRVREVIEIIWSGQEGGPTAEAIEHEACDILGVKSLRDYFRKPSGFFADHLKRYSKSRRQAPIYWPLSTATGSYTLWTYYHRLTDQTLHTVLADFLEPKIRNVQAELDAHQAGGNGQKAGESRDFLDELKDLRDEIERIIKLPWKPNLNDGVLITASPLWKLFRLTKWQKDLKACWEALEAGEYDWAHLAHSIWPARVEKACETDRSIAIAHGLEHLCKVEPPKPKKKRAEKAAEDESKNGEPKLI
jgi:hypothetical protein